MKYYIIGGIALLAAFAGGRFSAPEKIKIQTQTVTVEKVVKEQDKVVNSTTTETVKPDGTRTTIIVAKTETSTKVNKNETSKTETNKETTSKNSSFIIEGLASIDITNPNRINYGAHVSNNFLGFVRIGIFGFTDSKFGVSLGLQF